MSIAIRVNNLSKCYHLYDTPRDRLKQFVLPRLRRMSGKAEKQYFREFWALRGVSFAVKKGEVLGIIGKNGAGKSTLLQILCGTLTPTVGTVETNGRIAALLELGAGFNPEFTGRENVFMSAAIMGLSQEEIAARFEDIVDFSGIRDFIDQPVKTYSSGMYVRLAFSVAISVDPDILVIDEALSVGDGEFSRRSFDRIMALKEQNKTILFCSHSLYQVEALCNRAVWLNQGAIAAEGKPAEVVVAYDAFLSGKHHHNEAQVPQAEMPAQVKGTARIKRVEVSADGMPGKLLQLECGHGNLAVNVAFSSDPSLPAPSVAICITGQDGRIVTSAGTQNDGLTLERDLSGNGEVSLNFDSFPLLKGRYDIHAYLLCELAIHVYDTANMVAELNVAQSGLELGIVTIPHRWGQKDAKMNQNSVAQTKHVIASRTHWQDITRVWRNAHAHLRPDAQHLPLPATQYVACPDNGGGCHGRAVDVRAHLRVNGRWDEEALLRYCFDCDHFFAEVEPDVVVDAVNARLWSSAPTVLNIEPTTRCNFNCWYCIGRHMKQEDIRLEDFAKALDNFPSLQTIALVGEGEPLLHKDFFAMAHLAKDRGIKVVISSNGSTFSQSVVKRLCEAEVSYVSISIDSADPNIFSSLRIDGDLEKVWQGIRRLRTYRDEHGYKYPRIALKGTLFSHTENEIPAIVEAAKSHGVEIFETFQPLNPMKNYLRIYPQAHQSQLEYINRVANAIGRDSLVAAQTMQTVDDFCREAGIDYGKTGHHKPLRKNCDEQWIYSLLSGDITPCCQIKTPMSASWNLFDHGISEILADHEYENVRFNLWNGLFPAYCDGCWKTR